MTAGTPQRAAWVEGFAGLVAGALAGYACSRLRAPIPWMLGPLVTVAVLRVLGARVGAPPGARQIGQWVIGTSLGLYFTPQVVREVAGWWWLLAAGALFALAGGYGGGLMLARLAGIDRTTAVFASVPGGASEMAILGDRYGARADRVAAAQSLRILLVVIVVPFAFTLSGVHGVHTYVPGVTAFDAAGFAILMAATAAGGTLAQLLSIPNAYILGSLAVAIPLSAADVHLSTVPTVVSNVAQCLLGCMLGSRFGPDFLRGAPRFVGAVVATVLTAIGMAIAFGAALAWVSGLPAATVILGLAPGGIAEMCITAKVLQLGVPLVTAFHVSRVVVLLLCTGPLFALVRKARRTVPGGGMGAG